MRLHPTTERIHLKLALAKVRQEEREKKCRKIERAKKRPATAAAAGGHASRTLLFLSLYRQSSTPVALCFKFVLLSFFSCVFVLWFNLVERYEKKT